MNQPSLELARLLAAAIVSRTLREMLLTDPAKALEEGFENKPFELTPSERQLALSLKATTIEDFAGQLVQLIFERQSQKPEYN